MSKEVLILIKDAKYYEAQQSIVIVGVEVESRKPITQQITVKAFLEGTRLFTSVEADAVAKDPDRCRLLANNLKSRRDPFKLVFEGTQTEEELKAWFETEAAKEER
jgi:hypothetical protein